MNVKNGFSSTLNRFLGKKSKGHQLSKSTTNLSSHIDTIPLSSHIEQNRITPLPVATSNAPFEQTFRITVLLPKGQLYVARLGAKTKLQKLLELICENKQLDKEKYEFRHPIDTSQVFSFELTIGAVGLSEIRLCHKSEAYDNFNTDEIIKLRHTGRDSLSSSEFSSRNSKHTLKTASPYSSTNSLNSIDSTGMSTSYHRGPILSLPPQTALHHHHRTITANHHPPVAPARKKRVAPRPPSENSIPERDAIATNGCRELRSEFDHPKKEFHVSSPNLTQCTELSVLRSADFHQSNISVDCNGNNSSSRDNNNKINGLDKPNGHIHYNGEKVSPEQKENQKTRPFSMYVGSGEANYEKYISDNDLSSHRSSNGSIPSYAQNGSTETVKMPEPTPRKRITTAKKKAPAPPPRNIQTPVAPPRTITSLSPEKATTETKEVVETRPIPATVEVPQATISKLHKEEDCTLGQPSQSLHVREISLEEKAKEPENIPLNETVQVKEELCLEITTSSTPKAIQLENQNSENEAPEELKDSELSPIIQESPAQGRPALESKRSLESSSDEEEQIKVYNLKLGKTIVKPLMEHKTLEDLSVLSTMNGESVNTNAMDIADTISTRSASPGWAYTIPAPPNFADVPVESTDKSDTIPDSLLSPNLSSNIINNEGPVKGNTKLAAPPDTPITPIIQTRSPVDFQVFNETTTAIPESANSETTETIITSDIEDGYRVGIDKTDAKHSPRVDDNPSPELIEELNHVQTISPLNSLESYSSSKSDVINELNNVINDNKIETVIRKVEETEEIESVKPCNLSNFKIQTYSPTLAPVKTLNEVSIEPSVNGDVHIGESKPSSHFREKEEVEIVESPAKAQPSEEERLYKKRSSLTLSGNVASQLFKSRGSISRSDSFHSTRYTNHIEPDESLKSRSSSFISLLNAQKMEQRKSRTTERFIDTNKRKSSSELSIGESPSLQSLIVMKSILNSRKNSLNNETDTQRLNLSNPNSYMSPNEKFSPSTPGVESVDDCDSSKENSPKNKMLSQQIITVERLEKKEEPEKKWRYQGPPSINLSTWSERPKVQVSIKDDSDYKFGGGTNGMTTGSLERVNISSPIKPASPVRVVNEPPKVPFVRSVEYKKSTLVAQNDVSNDSSPPPTLPRPLSNGNAMSLGRMPKINRTNFVPTVKGFKNLDSPEEFVPKTEQVVSNTTTWRSMSNGISRSNSKVSTQSAMERNILKLSNQDNVQVNGRTVNYNTRVEVDKQENIFPFPVTLRKTGFKEKILNNEVDVQRSSESQQSTEQRNCAKIELKATLRPSSEPVQKIQRQQIATNPPPPPPPVIRSVVTKQNPGIRPSLMTAEPRDQLLVAIRSFNKNSLKRT